MQWIYKLFARLEDHSPRQRRGFLLLLPVVCCLLLTLQLWRYYKLKRVEVDTADYQALRQWVVELQDSSQLREGDSVSWLGLKSLGLPKEDINQATALELQRVKGIGLLLSRRLIMYREALGGFHSWQQLEELKGLPKSCLDRLIRRFDIGTPPKRLPINRLSAQDLSLHPYLSDTLAARIVKHRPFVDVVDFEESLRPSSSQMTRLAPYLSYEP